MYTGALLELGNAFSGVNEGSHNLAEEGKEILTQEIIVITVQEKRLHSAASEEALVVDWEKAAGFVLCVNWLQARSSLCIPIFASCVCAFLVISLLSLQCPPLG